MKSVSLSRRVAALVLVTIALTGAPVFADSLDSVCGDAIEPALRRPSIDIFEANAARSNGTVSLGERGEVLEGRFSPAPEMGVHVLSYLFTPPIDRQGGIALRFRARGWNRIGYLAYGWVDATGKYWHIKAKNPKQGEWLFENVIPGRVGFGLSNQWDVPTDVHMKALKLFMKGVPSTDGASLELDRIDFLSSQLDALDFALTIDSHVCYFSRFQEWWPFARLDSVSDGLSSILREQEKAKRPAFLYDAEFFLRTGNLNLHELPTVHWDIRHPLPHDLSNYTTSRFRWHALDAVQAMIMAFEATNNQTYLYAARGFVTDWLDDNFYQRSNDVRFAWYDHGTALRLMTLLRFWDIGLRQEFDARFMGRLLDAIWQHGDLLASEAFYARNQPMRHHNHAIFQDVALFLVHEFVPNLIDGKEWQNISLKRLEETFDTLVSIEGDYGIDHENSMGYQVAMTKNCSWVSSLIARTGRSSPLLSTCDKLERFSQHVSYPDGQAPSYGDTFRGSSDEVFVDASDRDRLGPSLISLVESGYVIVRDQETRDQVPYQLVLLAPSQTVIHKHKDNLSLTLWADGVEWMIDPGYHSYDYENPLATYARGPIAHNALVVPDREYSVQPGLATVRASAPRLTLGSPFRIEGQHRSYRGLVVKRQIAGEFGSGRLRVRDQVFGEDRPVTGHLMLHLGETVEADLEGEQIRLSTPLSPRYLLVYPPKHSECKSFSAVNEGTEVLGWSFPRFATAVPITTIRCEVHLDRPVEWTLEIRSN